MKKETQEYLLYKNVIIRLKEPQGFRYTGQIIEIGDDYLILENEYLGKKNYISADSISNLELDIEEEGDEE